MKPQPEKGDLGDMSPSTSDMEDGTGDNHKPSNSIDDIVPPDELLVLEPFIQKLFKLEDP